MLELKTRPKQVEDQTENIEQIKNNEREQASRDFWNSIETSKLRKVAAEPPKVPMGLITIKDGKVSLRFDYVVTNGGLGVERHKSFLRATIAQLKLGSEYHISQANWFLPPNSGNGIKVFDPQYYSKLSPTK